MIFPGLGGQGLELGGGDVCQRGEVIGMEGLRRAAIHAGLVGAVFVAAVDGDLAGFIAEVRADGALPEGWRGGDGLCGGLCRGRCAGGLLEDLGIEL